MSSGPKVLVRSPAPSGMKSRPTADANDRVNLASRFGFRGLTAFASVSGG